LAFLAHEFDVLDAVVDQQVGVEVFSRRGSLTFPNHLWFSAE
jgi:hypothetical protein